jgi:hypothetical protein
MGSEQRHIAALDELGIGFHIPAKVGNPDGFLPVGKDGKAFDYGFKALIADVQVQPFESSLQWLRHRLISSSRMTCKFVCQCRDTPGLGAAFCMAPMKPAEKG